MKFQRLIQRVMCEPCLITPEAHASIVSLIQSKLNGVALDISALLPEQEEARIEQGVGIIPVKGVIGKGLSKMEKSCGACDVGDIGKTVEAFVADPTCHAILLDVDSPGGGVTGVPELAAKIAAADETKPVYAFTEGQMDSAAYWLASGAREIIASPSAEVGSIGVYMPWMDSTKAYESAGMRVEVIKNTGGTFKGMGMPGTTLTDDQRAHLQSRVDEIFGMFTSAVTVKRSVGKDAMRGQTFMAASAKDAGLIEQVGDFAQAFQNCLDSH